MYLPNLNITKINSEENMELNLLDYHLNMDQNNVVLYYKGPFDEMLLAKVSTYLRSKFTESPRAGKRLFAVFMELAQNIGYYSAETNHFDGEESKNGIGAIVVQENQHSIIFTAGNLVHNETMGKINEKCERINKMDYEELRAFKRELRSKPRELTQKGGNIGLVQVALKSENALDIQDYPVDDENSFFLISTQIVKE